MGDLDAALGHHLDQVPVREAIRDVPTCAQLDKVRIESALLDGSDNRCERSRLSCQLPFSEAMDGLRVTIAPES